MQVQCRGHSRDAESPSPNTPTRREIGSDSGPVVLDRLLVFVFLHSSFGAVVEKDRVINRRGRRVGHAGVNSASSTAGLLE